MGSSPKDSVEQSCRFEIVPRFQAALSVLLEAYDYARELGRSVWDFAVEIHFLRVAGLTNSDLRWLVCSEFVAHAAEMTRTAQDSRVFHRTGTLTFTKETCFVITRLGAEFVSQGHTTAAQSDELQHPLTAPTGSPQVPQWDKERQELRLGDLVVKQFKVPAPNQELILATFEEEGWPTRVDDPLPPHPEQDSKRRLHDTITTLNRHQKHRLIRFSGDGSGEGVRWEPLIPQPDRDESS